MDMWGGGGGLLEYRSALLASHGFVSLALEYFSPGELQTADLQFRYFEVCFLIFVETLILCYFNVFLLYIYIQSYKAFKWDDGNQDLLIIYFTWKISVATRQGVLVLWNEANQEVT